MMKGHMVGLCVGLLAGVAIGILCAPRSGQETREMLMAKKEAMMNKAHGCKEECCTSK